MKRLIYTLLVVATVATSCTVDEGRSSSPMNIAYPIVNATIADIRDVNNLVQTIIYYHDYLTAENEEEQQLIYNTYLRDIEITAVENMHTLTISAYDNSGVQRKYSIVIKSSNGTPLTSTTWSVTRLEYLPYKMTFTIGADEYHADISSFTSKSRTGSADLRYVDLRDEEHNRHFGVSGEIHSVDTNESGTQPLTLDITFTTPAAYINNIGYSGRVDITCHDALYNTTDKVTMQYSEQPFGIYIYYGDCDVFFDAY